MHMPHESRPFDVASDEDLLASNFDRISKILPNHDQLPDFNGSGSDSASRKINDSINDHKTIVQRLINENAELRKLVE